MEKNKAISYLTDKDKSGRNTKGETGETIESLKSWLQKRVKIICNVMSDGVTASLFELPSPI